MKQVNWGTTGIKVPAIAMGCMRMANVEVTDAVHMIEKAVEEGVMRTSMGEERVKKYLRKR